MNILIIEDAKVQTEKIKLLLKRSGVDDSGIKSTTSIVGLKNFLALGDKYFDIAFVDLNLEDGNSLSEISKIKKVSKEIVVISSVISTRVVSNLIKNNVTNIIQKPFSKMKFMQVVDKIKNKNI